MSAGFRCPVCGGHELAGTVDCPSCQTKQHKDCWDWIGGCSIFGCASARAEPRRGERAPVETPGTLPQPAARGDLVIASNLQQDAFTGSGPLTPAVRALYFCMFAGLLPLMPPFAIVAAGAPLAATRFSWRFNPDTETLIGEITIAGVTVRRRTIPFRDVQRVEMSADRGLPQLTVVLTDGTTIPITYDVQPTRSVVNRMIAVARGVQAHASLHVTSSEVRDPVTMHKRLESLKLLEATAGGRARTASLGARATLLGMLAAVLLSGMPAAPAMFLAAVLGGGAVYATALGRGTRPLDNDLVNQRATATGVVRAEKRLRDMHPAGAQAALTWAGNFALVITTVMLMTSGTQLALIGLLAISGAAVVNAIEWAEVCAVQRNLTSAELIEDAEPPRLTEDESSG